MKYNIFERLGFRCTFQTLVAIVVVILLVECPILQAGKMCAVTNGNPDNPFIVGDTTDPANVINNPCGTCGAVSVSSSQLSQRPGVSTKSASCTSCGSQSAGPAGSTDDQIEIRAEQVDRIWIPTDRASNSSFTPGFYSSYDSQLDIFASGSGNTITYLNVLGQRTTTFVDGINGDTLDGVFHDLKNESVSQIELQNASGTVVTSTASATKVVVKHWQGGSETFEIIDLDTSSGTDLAGRLIKRTNRDGKELTIAYKTWTQTQLDASPARQWQIDTVSDPFGSQLTFTYSSTQYSGRWCVSNVARNDGRSVSMTYASNALSSVSMADGSSTTFSYSQNTANDTTVVTTTNVTNPALSGAFQLANNFSSGASSPPQVSVRVPGLIMEQANAGGQMSWKRVLPNDPAANMVMIINGGKASVQYGDGTSQGVTSFSESAPPGGGEGVQVRPKTNVRYVSTNANVPTLYTYSFVGYEVTYDSVVFGATATQAQIDAHRVPTYTDNNGRTRTFLYTTDGDISKVTYSADSTFEAYSYNSFRQKTRERNRNADVILHTYDSLGHKLTTSVGLVEQSGSDVQTSAYATTTYTYYGTSHANAGMLESERGPLYNSSTPTLHRTDYEYNSQNRLTKITGPADTSGGSRPVTTYTYNSYGLLATEVNPSSHTTSYTYDAMGRLTQTTFPDSSTEQTLYGTATSADAGRVVKTKNRANSVTTLAYDSSGRLYTISSPTAVDSDILDGQSDTNQITDANIKSVTQISYKDGNSTLRTQVLANGAKTEYIYDAQNRLTETKQYVRVGTTLSSKKGYEGNQLLYDEDPYGRRKYYGYRASDGTLIRTVTCTVPEYTLTNFTAVWNLTRNTGSNATFIVHDAIRDAKGQLTQIIDGRGIETRMEYDSVGHETNNRLAYGTSIEARTETVYDLAGNVTEVRTPRYFDSTDTNGYQKAREQWTYNGRGKVLTHIVSPGTAEGATESFTYDLHGHQATRTDFGSNVWTRIEDSCCDKQTASVDPLGHGTITNTDSLGRTTHSIQVSDVSTHVGSFANPTDAKTLSESTTKYDAAGRPVYQTTWLAARGSVDPANPPIAGVSGVALADGLTTQYFYDNNLTDGVGLDNSTGVSVLKLGTSGSGSFNVTLSNAISKLAATQANGGAGITFNSTAPGKATVTMNAEDEINFSITDAAGRTVMSGKLNNYRGSGSTAVNTLASWSTQLHDATTNLSGFGTLLVTKSIDALGNATKTWTDAAGRTLRSLDQLDKVTAVTYDAGGNQLTVRDPNNVGADMVYDSLGRNTQRTDTFSGVTKTDYDRAGNAVKQTDAKNKYTVIAFDSRNRRTSTTDRISAGTTFTYLATGQLASLTDAESQVTAYTYDARGSKLTEQYPDHTSSTTPGQSGYGTVTFVYDNAGRVLRKQDQLGDTCTFNYDLAGRLTSRNYRTAANSPSGTIADTDSFTFDRSGRMLTAVSGRYTNTVTYAFDPAGRKASESLTIASQTYTVGSEFNARNELIKYTYPDASISNRAYTARGALNELKLDSSVIDTRSYDDGGRMTSEVLGNGITETRAYRADNLLSSISYSNTNIGNLTYSWDANKNKTAETIAGVMSGYGFTSAGTSYDDEDRLTGYQRASGSFNQSWSLASVGDWNSVTTNGTAVTRTHGPTHELLTSGGQNVTTDVKGNQTVLPASLATSGVQLGLTWDFDNKLKSADTDNNGSADVTFEYDALGRRVARTEGSNAVVYFQADQQTITDYPRGGAASTATYRYVFGSYIDEPVVRKTTGTGGTILYFHRNQQYSITALTDSSGNVSERFAYTGYGQPTFLNASATVQSSSAASNRYTYTSREWDASLGLHHFRARWMSGLTGRFLTRDPIGFDGGRKNIFEFLSDSPLTRIDPMGNLDAGTTTLPCAAAVAAGIPVGTAVVGGVACGATFVGGVSVGYCVSYYPSTYCANKACEVHLWLINGPIQPQPVTQPQPEPQPVPQPVPVRVPPTRETCASQGRTKCNPSIDYVSGEPGAACRACAGPGFSAGPGATHFPSNSTDPLDLIDSSGFQYGTIKHHSCKKGKGSSDQFSVICGFCCVDGPNGPDFSKKCKCARTGGF